MRVLFKGLCFAVAILLPLAEAQAGIRQPAPRWSVETANAWYAKQPWLVGSNYIPSDAINQLEMWQADTFDPARIDTELGWAQSLHMNTMRVFLHDLLWKQDSQGFLKRMNTFLAIAQRHHIRPIFVLFDSCWNPNPKLGKQPLPIPGLHNSGWLQSPGTAALQDPSQYPRLEGYVKGVVGAFAGDKRILAWDVWNEPSSAHAVVALLPQVFAWAREAHPTQPLTSPLDQDRATVTQGPIAQEQLELSDVISFHNYHPGEDFEKEIVELRKFHRPIICTEYMARPEGSTFETILPVAKKYHIAAINWGFVSGKTQTIYPWDSWSHRYTHEPIVWFHDILHSDGTPYDPGETNFIRRIIASVNTTQ